MRKISTRILIIIITLSVTFFGYRVYDFLSFSWLGKGCGMDDGPFQAKIVTEYKIPDTAEIFKLKSAELYLDNRNDTLSPIIILKENGQTKWTLDTDTRNTEGYETTRIWKISHLKILKKDNPIQITFIGHWTYGAEHGSMRIDTKNGKNDFCLSW